MSKHFMARHRETKEEIYFGLEDIIGRVLVDPEKQSVIGSLALWHVITLDCKEGTYPSDYCQGKVSLILGMSDWFKDYELFYWHGGAWHEYE